MSAPSPEHLGSPELVLRGREEVERARRWGESEEVERARRWRERGGSDGAGHWKVRLFVLELVESQRRGRKDSRSTAIIPPPADAELG